MIRNAAIFFLLAIVLRAQAKPPLTIDDFFSSTDLQSALSDDGKAAVVATVRADWKHDRFREDLWLWREGMDTVQPLTQSGRDSDPRWSPDGRYIAFLSSRPLTDSSGDADADSDASKSDGDKETPRVWVIDINGGEAFPLYTEKLKTHAFAWNADGSGILVSVTEPRAKPVEEAEKRDWKDVVRWREQERGDALLEIALSSALPQAGMPHAAAVDSTEPLPASARIIAKTLYAISEIAVARMGGRIAFLTNSVSGRFEHPGAIEIYVVDGGAARQLTHNEAVEQKIRWSPDGKSIFFGVFAGGGSVDGKYRDVQGKVFSVDAETGKVTTHGGGFTGSWSEFALAPDGAVVGIGQLSLEAQIYGITHETFRKADGRSGAYNGLHTAANSPALLFLHSAINEPSEIYRAEDLAHLASAKPITRFNKLFTERESPQWKPYRWRGKDGKPVEGLLLYPPGKADQKNLRMLTLIHGGPNDADLNHFGADWYSWAPLAAANGWLVFQPNYRGSSGYGDEFMTDIMPHLVSRPGTDILAGVDALVKDGTADPSHLAIGGYSYGGYMTNWLITQTTRFRSAVSGAGAVEHASNWGNDDTTFDDAWIMGGTPWQSPGMYQQEAALFQFDKVKTPVHDVIGSDDVRVAASQGYLLERALDALGIAHTLLVFPGEGHSLAKNPWHGYIKVREELKWLEKYDHDPQPPNQLR